MATVSQLVHKKNFCLRKLGKRGKITVWLVDGKKIRRDLDREFTNFGHHFHFSFIPKYDFWIDQEAVPDERRFFIDHLLTEWRLIKKGYSLSLARKLAEAKEKSERERTRDYQKINDKKGKIQMKKVRQRLLKKFKKGISVWLVNGRLVRSVFKVGFTEGGHDLVYRFVPQNEVWLDNDLLTEERPYVLLHELFERSLMANGLPYHQAHRKASQLEWETRHHPEELKKRLASLGWKD